LDTIMMDSQTVLEMIEAADHVEPFCACGAPTQVVARGGCLWLACSTIVADASQARHRIFDRLAHVGHTDRLLIEMAA
jgi:hypothetical protein